MALFNPTHLTHPAPGGGINRFHISEYQEIRPGCFKLRKDDRIVTIYDSIKTSLEHGSANSIISAFCNFHVTLPVTVCVGAVASIEIDLPDGHSIFCVSLPTAVMGNLDQGEHLFPFVLSVEKNIVAIGTTAHPEVHHQDGRVVPGPVGKPMNLLMDVYARHHREEPGWQSLFYESLIDLNDKKWRESIFKLAVSVELWSQNTLDRFLKKNALPPRYEKAIKNSARNWDELIRLIQDMGERFGLTSDQNKLTDGTIKMFRKKVRDLRNEYSHSPQREIGPSEVKEAFLASLDILWTLHHINDGLPPK